MRIVPPGRNRAIVEGEGSPTQQVTTWMQTVSGAAQTLENAGSPEGVIEGDLGWECLDTVGNQFYKKSTSGGNTGWLLLGP